MKFNLNKCSTKKCRGRWCNNCCGHQLDKNLPARMRRIIEDAAIAGTDGEIIKYTTEDSVNTLLEMINYCIKNNISFNCIYKALKEADVKYSIPDVSKTIVQNLKKRQVHEMTNRLLRQQSHKRIKVHKLCKPAIKTKNRLTIVKKQKHTTTHKSNIK